MKYTLGGAIFGIVAVLAVSGVIVMTHGWLRSSEEAKRAAEEAADPRPAISYGAPGSVYLKLNRTDPKPEGPLTIPQAGAALVICYDDISWFRMLPYDLKIWFLDANGHQDDYDDKITLHHIHLPPQLGPYPKKCRDQVIPAGLAPGEHILTGLASPADHHLKAAPVPFPRIKFVVQ